MTATTPRPDERGIALASLDEREREIARLSRLYAALSRVNHAIVTTRTRDELFDQVCRALCEQGGFRMVWIGWLEPGRSEIGSPAPGPSVRAARSPAGPARASTPVERLELVPLARYGDDTDYLRGLETYVDDRPLVGRTSSGAFDAGHPYICNDLMNEPSTVPARPGLERAGFRASAAFPIRESGVVRGTLSVYAGEVGFFRDREVELLAGAANDLSFALDNLTRERARESAERAVRQERDFSEAVLNSLPGVLYLYDREGRFLRWSPNFERVTGYTAEEIAHLHPLDLFEGDDRARVASRIDSVFERGSSDVEADLVSKDGRATPYYFTGVVTEIDGTECLVGVGIDINERKHAEQERRATEGRYRTLFECAPDGIVIADSQSRYLDANASICRMLGHTREELIGLHASDIVVAGETPEIEKALHVIGTGQAHHREWQLRRKDGSVFPAEVMATVLPDGNLLGMMRDITERRQAERALRELNETLETKVAERTAELHAALTRAEAADRTKSAFLATMSHELRTPLNSIIGFTGILQQGLAGPINPEQTKQLGMVRGSARHLLELINDVLDLSKIEAEQLEVYAEPFDLRASLERVVASVRPQAETKGLVLRSTVSPALGVMVSDRRRVEQIVLNLVHNAIKFTERGNVTLTAEPDPTSGVPAVRIRVTDTGIGMRAEDLAQLFQPFRQIETGLDRRHEGTGLGLAICRRLAGLLGGTIAATSERDRGSEFDVVLPLTNRTDA